MKRYPVFAVALAAFVLPVSLFGQCFNMETLDAPGIECRLANHEYERTFQEDGRPIDQFTWVWYNDSYEDGGLTGYNYKYGLNNILCTRQTVVETQGNDYLQPALKMIPEGRSTSIRLGNPRAGGIGYKVTEPSETRTSSWHPQAEAMIYQFTVTADNPIVQFQYAAILDRTFHPLTGVSHHGQPHIDVYISNSADTPLDNGTTSFTRWGDGSLVSNPEWHKFSRPGNSDCYWKDWTTVGFDLTPYIGQTVYFKVANYECLSPSSSLRGFKYCGDHFGYLYFYLDCAPKEIETECLDNRQARLTAPDGFAYRWYRTGNPSVTLGTGRSLVVTADGKTSYSCQLSQLEGMTGSFVLSAMPICPVYVTIKDTICSEDLPYVFAGQNLTKSGHYEDTVHLTPEVDSITMLDLVVNQLYPMPAEEDYFCTGGSYLWKHGSHAITLTKAGIARDTIRYPSGCDSARYVITLTERDKIETTETVEICKDYFTTNHYVWNGINIYGEADDGLTYPTTSVLSGCDSIVKLHLNLVEDMVAYDTVIRPANFSNFTWHGFSIRWRTDKATTEAYYRNPMYRADTAMICVGSVYLRLFIVEVKDSTEVMTLCDSELPVTWRGHTIASAADNGKTYMQKGKDGLDSLRYTLRLTVYPTYNLTRSDTVCKGESYHFGDTVLTTTGVYKRTLKTVHGCDSTVTLRLTVQQPKTARTERVALCDGNSFDWVGHGTRFAGITAAGDYFDTAHYTTGCDSVYYMLRVTTGDSTVAHLHERICHGDSMVFFGSVKKESGVYRGVIENKAHCDSVIYMHLTILPKAPVQVRDTDVCAGTVFAWKGHTLTKDSTVYDTLRYQELECDSAIVGMKVHFLTTTDEHQYQTICSGESVLFDGINRTATGNYTRTEITPEGCTRTITLHLTVNEKTTSDTVAVACDSLLWHGTVYKSGGDYPWHTTNAAGCDSTRTLHLTINHATVSDTVAVANDSLLWHGTMYYTSGDYPWHTTNVAGCDSTRTLHLTLNYPTVSDTVAIACDSLLWHGTIYRSSGDYPWQTTNVAGYDSTRTLHLTVVHPSRSDTTAVACSSFSWHGTTYTSSGDYPWVITNMSGCDSIRTLHLTVNMPYVITRPVSICEGMTYPLGDTLLATTGIYTRRFVATTGCDSTVTINLTVGDVVSGDTAVTRCHGETYWFVDTLLTTSGDYSHLFRRTDRCDSLARLHFTILPDTVRHDSVAAFCTGDSLLWYGRIIHTADSFTHIVPNSLGCDSLVYTLRTTLLPVSKTLIDTTLVTGDSLQVADTVFYDTTSAVFHLQNIAGCDSVVTVRLTVQPADTAEVEGIFTVDTVCADDSRLALSFVRTQGIAVSYDLLFSDAAHAQGFQDITDAAFPDTAHVLWSVPMPVDTADAQWYVRPDRYTLTLHLTDVMARRSHYTASFTVLYPSWVILQRWNDVLTITNERYNGGYVFSAIRWEHNGQTVAGCGDNNAYYYAGDGNRLDYGTPYRAWLTRTDDGKTIPTCDFLPTVQYEDTRVQMPMVRLIPRRESTSREVGVEASCSGDYQVYDGSGKRMMNGHFGSAYGSPDILFAPTVSNGIYLIRFRSADGDEQTIKWLVY